MADADVTWQPDPDPTAGAGGVRGIPEGVLIGRYRLGSVLGRGGCGMVVAATDLVTGDAVAVKFVPPMQPGARRQLRRELAALLALRVPGVVRLRDEGVDGGLSFLVTDRVVGEPFSALAERGGPDVWLPSALALLEILARVHLAGVLHRDLKPANVLVDATGRPTLLDFGLALGHLVGPPSSSGFEGTPRYMAPEQRHGGPCDERTDLYAVGKMVLELVAGPGGVAAVEALDRPDVPRALAEQVRKMLAVDPADRPGSALEVLAALDVDPLPEPRRILGEPPWTEAQLQALFVDLPNSLLHLAEDAAALLVAAGGDDPEAICAELRRWIRTGLASWSDDGRVAVDRGALERIAASRPDGPEARLVAALEAGTPVEAVAQRARDQAAEMVREGAIERAASLLEAAALWARNTAQEAPILEERVATALALGSVAAVDRALHAVQRSSVDADVRQALKTLLRGSRAALAGNAEHAVEVLGGLAPLRPTLERWRHAMRLKAAHRLDLETHERILGEALAAMGSEQPRWVAMLRYRQGRWAEAGTLAEHEDPALAAAAWLEAGEHARAEAQGARAEEDASRSRNAAGEADARWIRRTNAYRTGRPLRPEADRIEVAQAVGPFHGGMAALVEAAVAWRAGDSAVARSLAVRASSVPKGVGLPAALLAEALCACLGSPIRDPILTADRAGALPAEIELQVLALLARGGVPVDRDRAQALLGRTDPEDERRLDLISLAEADRWLRAR